MKKTKCAATWENVPSKTCAVYPDLLLNAHVRMYVFWRCGPNTEHVTLLHLWLGHLDTYYVCRWRIDRSDKAFYEKQKLLILSFISTQTCVVVLIRSASSARPSITKTRIFKYIENFTTKNWKFPDKNSVIIFFFFFFFHISADVVLTSTHNLCLWAEIRKLMYTPVNPRFTV